MSYERDESSQCRAVHPTIPVACTRAKGHGDRHAAHGLRQSEPLAIWEDGKMPLLDSDRELFIRALDQELPQWSALRPWLDTLPSRAIRELHTYVVIHRG